MGREQVVWSAVDSPLGLVAFAGPEPEVSFMVLKASSLETAREKLQSRWQGSLVYNPGSFARLKMEIGLYFQRRLLKFTSPFRFLWGTPFQHRVWLELAAIPYGETVSYGEIARRVGRPGAARAVGQAVGANPLPLILPCHRVVRSNGGIGGFFYGGELKRFLLELEKCRK